MLPLELWESVFLHLAPEQILKLRAVNYDFRDVIDGSPEVQYLIDLWAAGLEVGCQDPSVALGDRRKQLDRYQSHWDSLQWVEHTSLPLPYHGRRIVSGGVVCLTLLAGLEDLTIDYRFIQLPSVLRGIPLKDWTVRGLPRHPEALGLLPEEDLLVVCLLAESRRSFMVKLLQMSDGQPHPSASAPLVDVPDYGRELVATRIEVQVTCSRLALTAQIFSGSGHDRPHFTVWDWKTGVKYVDVVRRAQTAQFVDEYRIFGVSNDVGPSSRWSVTLFDTSSPVEDPQRPKEIEFELNYDHAESLHSIRLDEGTYTQGARLGSPFFTDRKKHILCITPVCPPEYTWSLVIDYESICGIASENETASRIPWDIWKHKTTLIDQCTGFTTAIACVGPRVLVMSKKPYQGPWLRSFDFTPGACRYTKQIDTSLDDTARCAIRRAKLADTFPEGHRVKWGFSEDNVLAFTRLSSGTPEVLEMWTF